MKDPAHTLLLQAGRVLVIVLNHVCYATSGQFYYKPRVEFVLSTSRNQLS